MREPEYEKKGCWWKIEVTAYYNMTETGIPAFAAAPASLLIEENGEGWSENL